MPRYDLSLCQTDCHRKVREAWRGSQHDRAMTLASAATILGDVAEAKFTHAGATSIFFQRDGRFFVRTDGPDGKLADLWIRYTFGFTPLQQYLVQLPGGRFQAMGIAWDARPKEKGGQCHAPARNAADSHHRHAEGTKAARCASCPMPATTHMVVDPRHDHGFGIPRPDRTVSLGTPNACGSCHADKKPAWPAAAVTKRYPNEREVLLGLVLLLRDAGEDQRAAGYARRLAELEPDHPQEQRLVGQIDGGGR